jgi:hypothetical protein
MSVSFKNHAGPKVESEYHGVAIVRHYWVLTLAFFPLEAWAQMAVQSIDYSLSTQGRVTTGAESFEDSITGNIPGATLVPGQTVQQRAAGVSNPNFGSPTLDGITGLDVSDGNFGFSNPMRLLMRSTAGMELFRNPSPANSALGSNGSGSYFNEVVFTLQAKSSVRLTGFASGGGSFLIGGVIDPETGGEGVSGWLPALLGPFALVGFASVRLLNGSGEELYLRRTEAFDATTSNPNQGVVTLTLDAGTYRIEQSGSLTFNSDPVPSAVNSAAAEPEANSFGLILGFTSQLIVETTPVLEFIWQGGSSTGFSNPLNWKSQQVPGAADLAELSESGLKVVELAPAQAVQTARLLARAGSQTEVNLNGGLWNLGSGAGIAGDLRIEGASLELRGGTLESSAGTALLFNAAGGSLLELKQAGKLRLPAGVIAVGRFASGGTASLLVNGLNSLAEAATLVIGDSGPGSLQAFNQGSLFAGTTCVIGVDSEGETVVSGGAELEMGEGAILRIGQRGQGTLSVETGGSVLLGANARTVLGEEAPGSLDVRGLDSTFLGGGADMSVLDNGLLSVREAGEVRVAELDVVGGAVAVASAGRLIANGTLSLFSGSSLECAGADSLVAGAGLFVAGGQLTLREMGRMSISHEGARRARLIGGLMDVQAGTIFEAQLLEVTGGMLKGGGRVKCTVIHQSGIVSPGSSPGTLTIEGDYSLSGGKIILEIGGTQPGVTHDQLIVTGNFNFTGGVIELVFTNGFAPQAGQSFDLLNITGNASGTPVVNVRGLEPGWNFELERDPETGVLKVNSLSNGILLPPIRVPFFTVTPVAGGGSGKRLMASVTGPPDAEVFLEASDDLLLWELMAEGVFNGTGEASFDVTDPEATGSRRLYRFSSP